MVDDFAANISDVAAVAAVSRRLRRENSTTAAIRGEGRSRRCFKETEAETDQRRLLKSGRAAVAAVSRRLRRAGARGGLVLCCCAAVAAVSRRLRRS